MIVNFLMGALRAVWTREALRGVFWFLGGRRFVMGLLVVPVNYAASLLLNLPSIADATQAQLIAELVIYGLADLAIITFIGGESLRDAAKARNGPPHPSGNV